MTRWQQLGALYDRLLGVQGGFIVKLADRRGMLRVFNALPPYYKVDGPGGAILVDEVSVEDGGLHAEMIDALLEQNG